MSSPPADVTAARTLELAQDVAFETLADAERLAANVLAEAERRALQLVDIARRSATSMAQETRASIEDVFNARHDEMLALLAECRDELRAVLASAPGPVRRQPPSDGPRPRRAEDEAYLSELYHAIAGTRPAGVAAGAAGAGAGRAGPLTLLPAIQGRNAGRDSVVLAMSGRRASPRDR